MTKSTWIYALECPLARKIRYVGKSKDPYKRFEAHVSVASAGDDRQEWLAGLKTRELRPILRLLEEVPEERASKTESAWIVTLLSEGHPLTNKTYRGVQRSVLQRYRDALGDEFVEQLGSQIKNLREARGLSQTKLAQRAGLNPTTVNQIETGRREPHTYTLGKIANALDVQPIQLLIPLPDEVWEQINRMADKLALSQAAVVEMAVRKLAEGERMGNGSNNKC